LPVTAATMSLLNFRWWSSLARVGDPQKAKDRVRVATRGDHVERVVLNDIGKVGGAQSEYSRKFLGPESD
jgi:hypothetical protein